MQKFNLKVHTPDQRNKDVDKFTGKHLLKMETGWIVKNILQSRDIFN